MIWLPDYSGHFDHEFYTVAVSRGWQIVSMVADGNRGSHYCQGRLFDLPATEEKHALFHPNLSLCGMRDKCGIGDVTR